MQKISFQWVMSHSNTALEDGSDQDTRILSWNAEAPPGPGGEGLQELAASGVEKGRVWWGHTMSIAKAAAGNIYWSYVQHCVLTKGNQVQGLERCPSS